jgi:putative membrane protein
MVLTLLAAPLLVVGGVDVLAARALGLNAGRRGRSEAIAAPIVFAVALWFWHMPQPYDAALQSHFTYWSMEISLLAASVLLWRCLLRDLSLNPGAALAASFFTALQMTGLGALLTFAPRVLFAAHLTTTEPWGLSPLQDQQLGGLIMWLPFGMILTVHVVGALGAYMRAVDRRPRTI